MSDLPDAGDMQALALLFQAWLDDELAKLTPEQRTYYDERVAAGAYILDTLDEINRGTSGD